jgi:hypothetical protein
MRPRSLVAAVCAASLSATTLVRAQDVVLPGTHHLSETGNETDGTADAFRTVPCRFQVIYSGAHFLAVGATGSPVAVLSLKFRGEDTSQNFMYHSWTGAQVLLAGTPTTPAAMSTSFATNLAAATNLSPPLATTILEGLSLGTAPNNDHIVIDVSLLNFQFDPATENLLVDITLPNAPTPTTGLIQTQDTTGTVAEIGGRMLSAAPHTATTGTLANPPVLKVAIDKGTPWLTFSLPPTEPARREPYGAACGGSAAGFYQFWAHNEPFDLACSSAKKKEAAEGGPPCGLTLTPDNVATPTRYSVTAGAPPLDPAFVDSTPDSTADDGLVTHPLGFTFAWPGGSTTTIKASTNGFVWLDATMTGSDYSPSLGEWLAQGARLAPFWHDFHAGRNNSVDPMAGLHVATDTSGGAGNAVCYVTWFGVGRYETVDEPFQSHAFMQLVLRQATGVVEFRYGDASELWGSSFGGSVNGITGFSVGGGAADAQSRDLSIEVPFTTSPEGGVANVGISVSQAPTIPGNQPGRMFPGQTLTWNAHNIPAGALIAVLLLDIAGSRPGIQVPGITAPGCMISTGLNPLFYETFFVPGPTIVGTATVLVDPSWLGDEIHAQFIGVDVFGGPNLVPFASNALKHTVGLQ